MRGALLFKAAVERAIVVRGVEVERAERLDPGDLGEVDGLRQAAMAPADPRAILLVVVLCVVDQQVGALGQGVAGDPVDRPGRDLLAKRGLVVGQIDRDAFGRGNAVADGWPGVADKGRCYG